MIIIIDNYDSFTYNLYQYIGEISPDIEVYRNDGITVKDIIKKRPSHIVISPGPGFPENAGICKELVGSVEEDIPILGVCLGHQAISEVYGARVVHSKELVHGKATQVVLMEECSLFDSLPPEITAGRYHSLVVEKSTLPPELIITAVTHDGVIMGVKHKKYDIYGIQFHPESVLTPYGKDILSNFLKLKKGRKSNE